jgi:hypothetical protein
MLRRIGELYGNKLGASDGEIGHVKDFYFDDQNWAIRYVVADTGAWLPGRQVLISPYSLGRLVQVEKVLRVNLTRQQIEQSPSIESHKPVSRQYEEEYYRYYGWPYYWRGDALWGMSGFPILELPARAFLIHSSAAIRQDQEPADSHLRSTQAVNGYLVRSGDETIGHVCDFIMDSQRWWIRELVVKTGHRLSGKDVLIETKDVDRVSYDESTVFVNLSRESGAQRSEHNLAPVAGG